MKNTKLLQLMHDTMSPVNTIKGAIDVLKLNETDEQKLVLYKAIEERANKLNEVLDYYYKSEQETSKDLYSPAFVRAKHIADTFSKDSFIDDMKYITLYLSFHYEPEEHKSMIELIVKNKSNEYYPNAKKYINS